MQGTATAARLCAGKRFDLALGSLEGSMLSIEERCSVQWCQEDDTVWCATHAIQNKSLAGCLLHLCCEHFVSAPLQIQMQDISD